MQLLKQILDGNWLTFGPMMMFAAGAVADIAGGADAGTIADAGTEPEPSGEVHAEPDGAGDGTVDGETKDGPDAARPAQTDAEGKLDARTLPASVKTAMEGLKSTDPKAHAWLKDRLWAEKRFRDAVPGGLKEVEALQGSITGLKELAGPQFANAPTEQVLSAIKSEMSEWRSVDALLQKGDASVLQTIAEQFPEGFKKLMPSVMGEFAKRDLPAYQRHMAGVIDGELTALNVPNRMAFVERLLAKGDVDGAKAELAEIKAALGVYKGIASKPAETPAANPQADTQKQELDQREFKLWSQETATPINNAKTAAIKSEMKQYVPKGTEVDDETYEAIEVHALRNLDALLKADPNFLPTFTAFIENRDREGITKFMQSKLKELLPSKPGKMGPVEKAVKLFFRQAPKAPAARPATPAARPGAPAPKGWERVAADKAPAPHEIDRAKSSFEMIAAKGAILLNGRKVFWGNAAPA